jgi:hypothetical protein
MAVKRVDGSWKNFPYGSNFEDGASNNGGFNLVEHPDKIDLITEFEKLPRIKEAVYKLNTESTKFMTTGFLFDKSEKDDCYIGYIEFCFRPNINHSSFSIYKIDEMFLDYLRPIMGEDFAEFYQREFVWEIREGTVQQSPVVPVYSVFFRAMDHHGAELELVPLLDWLRTNFR